MCTVIGFDARFDSKRSYLKNLLTNIIRNKAFLRLLVFSKDIFSGRSIINSKLPTLRSIPMPEKAVESFRMYVWLNKDILLQVLLRCREIFFQFSSPMARSQFHTHHLDAIASYRAS